ncbi:MAG: RNA-binding protein [Rhodospirillales bacterium]|nr:RNA-binding protein [Rhodospirillales bacterium]
MPNSPANRLRRCLASGAVVDRAKLVRFVVGPEGEIVPDIDERLPGRGLWISADAAAFEMALRRRLFARAARAAVRIPDSLELQVETQLLRRCRDLIGLALRAGQAVFGLQKVRDWLGAGKRGYLIEASDGAPGECQSLRALSCGMPVIVALSADELGQALGRDRAVHGIILAGALAERFSREALRLAGLRGANTERNPIVRGAGQSHST